MLFNEQKSTLNQWVGKARPLFPEENACFLPALSAAESSLPRISHTYQIRPTGAAGALGRHTVNTVPCSAEELTSMVPPCPDAISRTM
jgi:hypothetical protein